MNTGNSRDKPSGVVPVTENNKGAKRTTFGSIAMTFRSELHATSTPVLIYYILLIQFMNECP